MKTTLRLLAAACLYVTTAFAQNQLTANLTVTNQEIVGAAAGSIPVTAFEVDSTSTSSPRGIMSAQFNSGTDGARFHGRKARGTRAAPTTVVTGDNLTRWVGSGYDGSNFLEDASIIFGTEGTVAATRIPTNIQFWTATNAAPSVLTLAGQFNSSQQLLMGNGTAGAPSWSWTSAPTNGLYYVGSNQIGVSNNGVQSLIFASGGTIYGATSNNLILAANGSITLNAAGTNQSVAVNPSGTGSMAITGSISAGSGGILEVVNNGNVDYANLGNFLAPNLSTGFHASYSVGVAKATNNLGTIGFLYAGSGSSSNALTFAFYGGADQMRLLANGHILGAGLTVDGTGVLQFPAGAADNTSGITFGADTNLFRSGVGQLDINYTAGGAALRFLNTGVVKGSINISTNDLQISSSTAANVILRTNNTTALTLDSSQNATFAQDVVGAAGKQIRSFGNISLGTNAANSGVFRAGNAAGGVNWRNAANSANHSLDVNATDILTWTGATDVATSGTRGAVQILPTYNQASGTAANTDLLINRTQTAVGSGAQLLIDTQVGGSSKLAVNNSGVVSQYNGIATAGNGVVTVQGAARATAQTGANASVATYTVGASDASFEVSANILVTTATTHAFTCTCAYTDEGNTARTITFTFSNVGGTFLTSIANTGGTVPYEGVPLHIRAKASTSITIATTGTFTSVVYNVEGNIRKLQ